MGRQVEKVENPIVNNTLVFIVFSNFSMIFDEFLTMKFVVLTGFYKQTRGLKMCKQIDVAYKTQLKSRISSSTSHQ